MATSLFDSSGQRITLGRQIGTGGEGTVFEVCDNPNRVAKIYHPSIAAKRAAKVNVMSALRQERILNIAAWPLETLYTAVSGEFKGFLMPKLAGKAVHNLYGPKSRLTHFPTADWRFLISAAANVARAFSVIHEYGHVIGDVNHGNLFVSEQATVKLIDCDSFQILSQGQAFVCEVGVDMYTPPELQGRRLHDLQRTPNHDAFGLAVMIFHLLFMGRHPFSGGYLGMGEMPIPKAIGEFRFAYGPGARERQMASPPATLPLEASSAFVALLFERAFAREGTAASGRPKPQEWVLALEALAKALKPCSQHSGHYFWNGLAGCPWCLIESRSKGGYFPFAPLRPTLHQTAFDLDAIWRQIEQIAPPSLVSLPDPLSFQKGPSSHAVSLGKEFRSGIGKLTSLLGLNPKRNQARQDRKRTLHEAKRELETYSTRFHKERKTDDFQRHRQLLEARKAEHIALPARRQSKRTDLEKNIESSQHFKFLDAHRLGNANIAGIGSSRRATLRSYGIETAADIVQNTILAIPGFGPSLTSDLMLWRQSVERQFVFDPSKGVDMADYIAIDREIDKRRQVLEAELLSGPADLAEISRRMNAQHAELIAAITSVMEKIAQAEADLKIL